MKHVYGIEFDILSYAKAYKSYIDQFDTISSPMDAINRLMDKDNLPRRLATTMLAVVAIKMLHCMSGEVASIIAKANQEEEKDKSKPEKGEDESKAKPEIEKDSDDTSTAADQLVKEIAKAKSNPAFIALMEALGNAAGGSVAPDDDDDEEDHTPFKRN